MLSSFLPRRSTCALSAGLLAVAMASVARAAPPTAELLLTRGLAAEGCTDAQTLQNAVEQRLNRTVFAAAGTSDLLLDVQIQAAVSPRLGWDARLILSTRAGVPSGGRDLHTDSHSCRDLDNQLALVVALLLDAEPQPPPAPSIEAPKKEPAPPPPPIKTIDTKKDVSVAKVANDKQTTVSLLGLWGHGVLPDGAWGLGLHVTRQETQHWAWRVGVDGWWPQSIAAVDNRAGADFVRAHAQAGGCFSANPALRAQINSCLTMAAGVMRAQGAHLAPNHTSWRPLAAPSATLELIGTLRGSFKVLVGTTVEVPLVRDSFAYQDPSTGFITLFRMSALSIILSAGAAVAF